jgi:hypothetical protein
LKSFFECSHPRFFAPLQGFSKVMMLTIKPLIEGISSCQEVCHP